MRAFIRKAHRAAVEYYLYGNIPLAGSIIAIINQNDMLWWSLLLISVLVDVATYLYKESDLWEAPRINRTN